MQQDGWQLRIILMDSSEDSTQILLSPTTPHIDENGRTRVQEPEISVTSFLT